MFCKGIIHDNLNKATPFPKIVNPRHYIAPPPGDPMCLFDILFILNKHNYMQRE